MTILFAGGELSSFIKFNAVESVLTGSFSAPARCGIHVMKNGYIRTDTLGDVSEIWIHFDINIGLVSTGLLPIQILNASGTSMFSIDSSGRVFGTVSQIGIIPLMTAGRHTVDIHLRNGTTGLVEVYVGSQALLSSSGPFNFNGLHTLILSPVGTDTTSTTNTIYSQVIIANETTVGSQLATLSLDTVGANNAWVSTSNNAASDINEIILDPTTYISASTAGLVETWVASDITTSGYVRAIIVSALAQYGTTGPKNMDAVTRINGANYYSAMSVLGTGYTPVQTILNTNPVTNAAWTVADVNSAEFGVRSRV